MKIPLVLANWKSFKNPEEAKTWLENISLLSRLEPINYQESIILCVPFIDLPVLKDLLGKKTPELDFVLGAQNISPDQDKPTTGETTAEMVKDFISYVIIGHSERRSKLGETTEMVNQKIKICRQFGLKTIVCVSNTKELEPISKAFPSYNGLFLYEPLSAIGSGQTESPEKANIIAGEIKEKFSSAKILYGGSVNDANVKEIVSQEFIDGVAVGGASLEVSSFWRILKNVSK